MYLCCRHVSCSIETCFKLIQILVLRNYNYLYMKSGTLWSLRLKFTNCVAIGHERNWISLDLDLDTGERLY